MALYDFYDGVPREKRTGEEIAQALGKKNSVIMRHHGALTVGSSIEAAAFLFLELEKCAEEQLKAQQTYKSILPMIDSKVAQETQDYLTTPHGLWLSFQSEYSRTCYKHGLKFKFTETEIKEKQKMSTKHKTTILEAIRHDG